MTKEHDLIKRYFAPLCSGRNEAPAFGLLDDTALLPPTNDQQLLVTTDALVAGVHFFPDDPAGSIAQKALAVNISDIIAKGGMPSSYLLTLALPKDIDGNWLQEFASGLGEAQRKFSCQLVGGDTVSTDGPLMISVTLIGQLEAGKMVRRNGARPGDLVYVSGTVGDAALGLIARTNQINKSDISLSDGLDNHLIDRYLHPQPRLDLAPAIAKYASAAMDVSDGLIGDFSKLCAVSKVGGCLRSHKLPLSKAATSALAQAPDLMDTILSGGDDYEILATIPADRREQFELAARNMRRIGEIVAAKKGVTVLDAQGQTFDLAHGAFDHFGDIEGKI